MKKDDGFDFWRGIRSGLVIEALCVLVVLSAIACPRFAHAQTAKSVAAVAASTAFDLTTTKRSLDRGARELNPVLGDRFAQIAGRKIALTSGLMLAAEYLRRHGHPKIAKTLLVGNVSASTVAGVHNIGVSR